MNTEKRSKKYSNLDLWDNKEVLETILESQLNAICSIKQLISDIDSAVTKATTLLEHGGRLIFAGAGTSGRLAAQESAELYPTYAWPKNKTHYLIAGGDKALSQSVENAEDSIEKGEHDCIKIKPTSKDVVICVAASGRTPYTLGVLRTANQAGALTIGISSLEHAPILNEAKIKLFTNTGSEVIAGSTRMKAGTAQKVILNMITTALMIKLNRTYDGYMVDVVASNEKLQHRAIHIISEICLADSEAAKQALLTCHGNVKLACVYLKCQSKELAEEILSKTSGNLRKSLEKLPEHYKKS